jgi:hypothetical protein
VTPQPAILLVNGDATIRRRTLEERAIMLHEIHEMTLQRIGAGESGYAIANVQKNGTAQDLSFHKGNRLVGTYHGGPQGLMNGELKEAMILSIAQGRIVASSQQPGAASPATFYKIDIVRMIRERRLRGEDQEADVLERYRTQHPEVFVA